MEDLAGKTAVVTGAANGMGKAFALRFAAAGMNVVLSDVEVPLLDAAVEEVRAVQAGQGTEAIAVVTDVSDSAAVDALATEAFAQFETVEVLCNNAGVAGGSLTATPGAVHRENWEWVMGVNFWGVVNGHHSFLPAMLDQGTGHIVNTASMAGHLPGHSAYSASKWAVVGITEGLYNALDGSGVGVSCLCPGWVKTGIAEADRNRPEWAAPDALAEPDPDAEARMAFVKDQIASGMAPTAVADLVHDAIVADQFWIFTDSNMVEFLRPRFGHVLDGSNPDRIGLLG